MTPPRAALAGLALFALAVSGCSSQAAAGAQDASLPPAVPTSAPADSVTPQPDPTASTGLLDSSPATLDALRAEQGKRPVAVRVPGADDDAPVEQRTTDPVTGGLDLPDSPTLVAWWASGAAPGTGAGSVVLAAHVSYAGRTGPFTRLSAVEPGARVVVTSADGSATTYAVQSTRRAPKTELDRAGLFRTDGPPVLVLLTCGGRYDPATRSFDDNVVVTAVPV